MEEKKFPGRMLKFQTQWDEATTATAANDTFSDDEERLIVRLIETHIEKGNFSDVYKLIQNGKFRDNLRLIDLWDEAHYAEKEKTIRRPLTPLMRFRIRQRYPPPASICPNGVRKTLSLPLRAKLVLGSWYESHKDKPFPSRQEKEVLAQKSGLTLTQVQTWFANLRRRKLKSSKRESKDVDWIEHQTPQGPRHQFSSETSSDFASNFKTSGSSYDNYSNCPLRISNEAEEVPLDLSSTNRNFGDGEANTRLKELLKDDSNKSHVEVSYLGAVNAGPISISSSSNFIEGAVSFYLKTSAIAFPGYLNPWMRSTNTNINQNQPRPILTSPPPQVSSLPYYWRQYYRGESFTLNSQIDSPEDLRLPSVRNRIRDQ